MQANNNICSRILTPKQVGPICWFMATFVAMFYSQRSRKILLEASKNWYKKKGGFTIFGDKKDKLFKILKHVLDDKYLKVGSRESEDYKKFSDDTFVNILSYLNIENKKSFPYDPKKVKGGFHPEFYIGKLYKLLNVDYKIFDYFVKDNIVAYSYLNEEYEVLTYTIKNKLIAYDFDFQNLIGKLQNCPENNYAPPILIINVNDTSEALFYNNILKKNIINNVLKKDYLKSMQEKIYYNGAEYNLDSVILTNWNINKYNGHAIAGITCKKNKYIYNGWTRTSMDPVMAQKIITRKIPCELMKYDWKIIKNYDFCLNTAKCIPDVLRKKLKTRDICFNFSKGKKLLIYVRKDAKSDTSSEKDVNVIKSPIKQPIKSPKKCEEGKVLNPKTGRCILIKNANKLGVKPKSPKKCEEGKVLNPKTGRCILIKNANKLGVKPKSPKKCKEGKVLNPKTGRCILIKNANKLGVKPKSPKKCKEGKVLNPKTGRCILIKNAK